MAKNGNDSGATARIPPKKSTTKQFKWKWHVKFHKLITIPTRRTKPRNNPSPMRHNAPTVWLPEPIPSIHHGGLVRNALDPYNPVRIWDLQRNHNITLPLPGPYSSLAEYARDYFGDMGYDHYHNLRVYHHAYPATLYHHLQIKQNQTLSEVRGFDPYSLLWHEYYIQCYHWWMHHAFQNRPHFDSEHNMRLQHCVSTSSTSDSTDLSCDSYKMEAV